MTKGRELKATRKLYVSFALWAVSSVLVERQLCKLDVKGSIPLRSTISRDSLMVRYWAHNPGTDNACASSTLAPARL